MRLAIDLQLRRGDFRLEAACESHVASTAIFGASGAGKSSLLMAVAGLVPATGRVVVDGVDLHGRPAHQRRVGFVFQDARLLPHLDVRANLLYGQRLVRAEDRRVQLGPVVDLLGLSALLDRRPRGLSGGEAKRVALGRALLASPRLLLLDEPLAGVDVRRRAALVPMIRQVRELLDVPMLVVTHSVAEVLQLSDEVLVLDQGRVLGHGPFFSVLGEDGVFPLAEAHGLTNLLAVHVSGHDDRRGTTTVQLGAFEIRLARADRPMGPAALTVRPEDVLLSLEPVQQMSARNCLPGRIAALDTLHGRVLVTVDIGVPLRAELTQGAVADLALAPGREVWAVFKATALRWL